MLEARIVAVASEVTRCYVKSDSIDAALEEIESKRGQCYDESIVDV